MTGTMITASTDGVAAVRGAVSADPPPPAARIRAASAAPGIASTLVACYCRLMLLALAITRLVMTAPAAIARATMTPIQISWAGISPRSPFGAEQP